MKTMEKVKVAAAVGAPIGMFIWRISETAGKSTSLWVGSGLAGVWMLATGCRGRRVGNEPRCAKCSYILLHVASNRCPECGTEISIHSTVTGERRWRRGWVIARFLFLMVALFLVVRP